MDIAGKEGNPFTILLYMLYINLIIFVTGVAVDWMVKRVMKNRLLDKISENADKMVSQMLKTPR